MSSTLDGIINDSLLLDRIQLLLGSILEVDVFF